jgi:NitT/TauT family transport system permease protein
MSLSTAAQTGESSYPGLDVDVEHVVSTPRRRRRLRFPYALATVAVAIVLWQVITTAFNVPLFLLPPPSAIATYFAQNFSLFATNSVATITEIGLGFLLSVAIGVPLAVAIVYSSIFERAAYPLIVTSQTVPKVAIAPLVLVWFGFGVWPKVGIVVLISFFPIVINTVVGFKSVPREMIDLVRSMGAKRVEIFRRIMFPNALPSIFSGMKIASTLAVIGAVVAEFVGATMGLGYLITRSGQYVNMKEEFSAVVVLSVLGIAFFYLISLIERMILPWHASLRQGDLAGQL